MRKKVLLHICCGVCAGMVLEQLSSQHFSVTGLFFNPNIHPYPEYLRRLKAAEKITRVYGVTLIEDAYETSIWFDECGDLKDEREGGRRCQRCYQMRLQRTFEVFRKQKFDYFTTTLTISPHKKSAVIIDMGKRIGGDFFLPINFKKNDGFKRTIQVSKEHNLYRQHYCGCVYSTASVS